MTDVVQLCHLALLRSTRPLAYLLDRGVNHDAITKFKIGWFDVSPLSRYYKRVVFPLRDAYGNVHTMQGRALDENTSPKYWHGPYDKQRVLYGVFENIVPLVHGRQAVLVEGPLDVIALWQAGIPAVSAFGSAFTSKQGYVLRRYVDQVALWYDADSAGESAAVNAFKVLTGVGMRKVVAVKSPGDPAAFAKEQGVLGVKELMKNVF